MSLFGTEQSKKKGFSGDISNVGKSLQMEALVKEKKANVFN